MKKRTIRGLFCCLFLLSAFLSACVAAPVESRLSNEAPADQLSGKAPAVSSDGNVTLHVLTEFGATRYGASDLLSEIETSMENISAYYQSQHKNVTIRLEILPRYEIPRKARIQQLRTEIMAGKGPDVYLLPTGDLWGPEGYTDMPHLFPNVEERMRGSLFLDISEYYEQDEELKKDELKTEIMDAGIFDGRRYILPLGWDMPVLYANKEQCRACGIDLDRIRRDGVSALYDEVNDCKETAALFYAKLAAWTTPNLSLLPRLFDYDSGTVSLTADDLSGWFTTQRSLALKADDFFPEEYCSEVMPYMDGTPFQFETQCPFTASKLSGAAELLGIAKSLDMDIVSIPLKTTGGNMVAAVTYWGALSANCDHPAEAYDFLRLFLSSEVQHGTGFGPDYSTKLREATRTCGWPVRINGSLQALWRLTRGSGGTGKRGIETAQKLVSTDLSDEDIPLNDVIIDEVRYPNELYSQVGIPLGVAQEESSTDADIEKAIDEYLTLLKYHIAES